MKPGPAILILTAGILIGGILGWTLKPTPELSLGFVTATTPERQRPPRPASVSTSRFASEFKAIKDRSFKVDAKDPGQDSAYLEALAAALLKSVGGYAGLEESQPFFDMLNAMAVKDLGRTLDWMDQTVDEASRARLYRDAIQAGMRNSPVRDQLDLFMGRDFTTEEIGSYAGNLMLGYEIMSTETALYLLGHVQPSDGGYSGGDARFDEHFDYAGFANATLQIARANENKPPNVYPMNFFSEWTRMDPQAAAGFYFTHCIGKDGMKLPYNTLETFMQGLRSNIPEADYSNFLNTALSQQLLMETPDQQLIGELLGAGISMPDRVAEDLNQIPDPIVREKLIADTVSRAAESASGQRGNLMQLRGALSLFNDPVVRQVKMEDYARELGARSGYRETPQIIRNLCNQLAILGHSETDLQRIRNAAVK